MTDKSYSRPWAAPLAKSAISAQISIPGSKSLTNRELVLSALASGPSEILNPLDSRDSNLMIQALKQLGSEIESTPNSLRITPRPISGPAQIDCGLAGTVMRFVPPVAALAKGEVSFDGDVAARSRPMKTTVDSLRALGVEVSGSGLPFTIHGTGEVVGGELSIDASESSQFVSGLLLVAARFKNGLTLNHSAKTLPSMPHIDMTIDTLAKRGVKVLKLSETSWQIEPGEISGRTVEIEPDLSNAGPFMAAALVAGGTVTIENWPTSTTQVGNDFIELLTRMGGQVSRNGTGMSVTGTGEINGIEIDLSSAGELTPVIAALAALAKSKSVISGVAHLRGHETNRLKALVDEINSIGGRATETQDGLIVEPADLRGGLWKTYSDHRMATAGAIIGLRVPGIEIEDITVTSKTMPGFELLWSKMLGATS
ncbi:MAG: 3-phosphoshikimate 1-carboxyvinyltransferase [Actinobacteria bacterium]|uniref:3-phosphoshikimate 1-carboxyvinyltransferase n=1 Tax=freshwater metagenome TaxID=449393 RepID=A0A6J6E052_9ZZZZ|nr:3-phosphoshikimate 1-carboxyvinyltransferase [Actinomycetota bacterium]